MKEALALIVENISLIMNMIAVAIIAWGTIEVCVATLVGLFSRSATRSRLQDWYINYARWLVAGLTFQLAADIVGTATGASWDEIGRLASIAAIRTFLNFFLDRDIAKAREQRE
jgi:uncharacterized membrane protein